MSQLFVDRAIIANATGCSSFTVGTYPPHRGHSNKEGRSRLVKLAIEDNAELV
jgi:pyruvate/2-oxoacid:ferredoxin oxidoreductase beta subunit